jgi:hypothetical protein
MVDNYSYNTSNNFNYNNSNNYNSAPEGKNKKFKIIASIFVILLLIISGLVYFLLKDNDEGDGGGNSVCMTGCLNERGNTQASCNAWCATQNIEGGNEGGAGNDGGNNNTNPVNRTYNSSGLKILPPASGIYLGSYNWVVKE